MISKNKKSRRESLMDASNVFADKIDLIEPVTITLSVSFGAGTTWSDVGQVTAQMFFILLGMIPNRATFSI